METFALPRIIKELSSSKITYDETIKNYLFNGENPRSISTSHYSLLLKNFEDVLNKDLKNRISSPGILISQLEDVRKIIRNKNELIGKHRVSFVYSKAKNKLSEEALDTLDDILVRLQTEVEVLRKMRSLLKNVIKVLEISTHSSGRPDDYLIPFKPVERATIKLPRLEAIMLLYALEKTNLITFVSEAQRNRFIEANFNFTEERNNKNKGKAIPIKNVNTDFADFKSFKNFKQNTQTLNEVIEKIEHIKQITFKKR